MRISDWSSDVCSSDLLTIYCRRLEPDIQIIARANLDRNVDTLHRAGADAVLSYASLGASAIWNALGPNDILVLAEGLVVFRLPVPEKLAGRSLIDTQLRQRSEEHTSELQSLMRISYAVFCSKK